MSKRKRNDYEEDDEEDMETTSDASSHSFNEEYDSNEDDEDDNEYSFNNDNGESSSNSNPRTSAVYQPTPMRIIDAPKAFLVMFSSSETDDHHVETNIAEGRECSDTIQTIHPWPRNEDGL